MKKCQVHQSKDKYWFDKNFQYSTNEWIENHHKKQYMIICKNLRWKTSVVFQINNAICQNFWIGMKRIEFISLKCYAI